MTDTTKLAERIEALEGPCREVDAEIAVSVLGMERDGDCFFSKDEDFVLERDHYSLDGSARELPYYTASLDAAMTLVPEGWYVSQMGGSRLFGARVDRADNSPNSFETGITKASLSLALCAAALRAQEAHNG